jgi:hypothetical protein
MQCLTANVLAAWRGFKNFEALRVDTRSDPNDAVQDRSCLTPQRLQTARPGIRSEIKSSWRPDVPDHPSRQLIEPSSPGSTPANFRRGDERLHRRLSVPYSLDPHTCMPGFFFLMGAGIYWFAATRRGEAAAIRGTVWPRLRDLPHGPAFRSPQRAPSRGVRRTFLPNLITGRNVDQTHIYVDLMVSLP